MNSTLKHKTWLSLLLFTILLATLAACGSTTSSAGTSPSSTTATPVMQTATPTSPSQAVQNTPTQDTSVSKPHVPLTAIRMLDSQNGWALTASSILKTADGGVHWRDVTPGHAALNAFAKGNFLNGRYAWIAIPPANQTEGPGISVLHTANGGSSWQSTKINDPSVAIVDVPHFVNVQEGWIEASSTPGAGSAGSNIWHTTDGGQRWTKLASNEVASGLLLGKVTGISFRDTQLGIATGNRGAGGDNSLATIAVTQNGGRTWQIQSLPHLLGGYVNISNTTQPPVFFNTTVILPVNVATSSGDLLVLYRSNTSGRTWFQTSVVHISASNTYVLDGSHAWATDDHSGLLYSTANGGTNWNATSSTAFNLKALSFISANSGWGLTSQTLLHTTDGGKTWQQIAYSIQ